MSRASDKSWKKWGQDDPYFAVLTHSKYRKSELSAHREEFFATGEAHIAGVLAGLKRHFGYMPAGNALDFGCGVGRLLRPLARSFEHVTGVDISEAMLAEAETNLKADGHAAFELVRSDDQLSGCTRRYDFVHTHITMQHIPTAAGYSIIRAMLGKLNPGGAFYIHVCTARRSSPARRFAYFLRHHVPFAQTVLNLLMGQPAADAPMQMNNYDAAVVEAILWDFGVREYSSTMDLHEGTLLTSYWGRLPA